MTKTFLILIFLLSFTVKSQNSTKEEIIGNWQVTNVVTKSNNKNIIDFSNSFKNAIFSFKENRDFMISFKKNTRLTLMTVKSLDNTKWLFDERDDKFKIGTHEDHYSIMALKVKIKGNRAYINLDETNLNLELIRI